MSVQWDPDRPADIFFHQSAFLRIHAHHLRLFLHRSNLCTPQGRQFSLPICASAARACCSILEVYVERFNEIVPFFQASVSFFLDCGPCRLILFTSQWVAFSSALILLSNIWSKGSGGLGPADLKDLSRIHICMRAMHAWNSRRGFIPFHSRWDVLSDVDGDHKMSVVSESAYVLSLCSHYHELYSRGSRLLSQTGTFWSAFSSLGGFLYRHRGQHYPRIPHLMLVRYARICTFRGRGRCHHLERFGIGWV
jgi:hypothetical protein